jgi:methyl-accepting chemotaxis protein
VAEMDKVTQQNAASAEESSSAASELSGQSEELAAMVGAFQLGQKAATAKPAAPHAAAARRAPAKAPGRGNGARAMPALAAGNAFPMDDEAELRDF